MRRSSCARTQAAIVDDKLARLGRVHSLARGPGVGSTLLRTRENSGRPLWPRAKRLAPRRAYELC